MAKKKGDGFQSSAGLIRYFDSEDDKAPKIDPRLVVIMCIGATIVVTVANHYWPT